MESPNTSTKFSSLIVKLLKSIDSYNNQDLSRSTDTVDQNSSGEVAGICINNALSKMYDLAKDSRYLQAKPTQKLKATQGQEFIELDIEPTLDEIESVNDTDRNFKLVKKSWWWYRRYYPNPAIASGIPNYYIRRFDRIYLAPTPSQDITYTVDFIRFKGELVQDSDVSVFPSQYDYWIIAEARVEWAKMEDPDSIPPIIISERNDARQIALDAIYSGFDDTKQLENNFYRRLRRKNFERIVFDTE